MDCTDPRACVLLCFGFARAVKAISCSRLKSFAPIRAASAKDRSTSQGGRACAFLRASKSARSSSIASLAWELVRLTTCREQDGDWLKPDRHEFLLRHVLRVRPNGVEARTGPRLISTWDDDAGDVEYAQHNPGAGVGFGNPR